jgi:transitional endoplasmic reticulum ATPase
MYSRYGPPGTGKTSLAKAAASEASATLLTLTPSGILSKYQGESERAVRDIFSSARSQAPACIFLDEIDALGPSRDVSPPKMLYCNCYRGAWHHF